MGFHPVGSLSVAGALLLGSAAYYVVCGCTLVAPSPPPPPPSACDPGASFDPAHPEASGYQVVFEDHFPNLSTVDLGKTGNTGYHWYLLQPFGFNPPPASDYTVGTGGHLLMTPSSSASSNFISTAYPNQSATNGEKWVGTSFGPGFFESTFAFDGPSVNTANGFPAFWSMSVEHWANQGGDQWPGQAAGYAHFTEDDFFEYDAQFAGSAYWGSTMHDWYGIYNVTCGAGNGFCNIANQGGAGSHGLANHVLTRSGTAPVFNATTYHTMQHLWVRGDSNDSFNGYVKDFMDNLPTVTNAGSSTTSSVVAWTHDTMPAPASLPNSPEVWSIQDDQRLVAVLQSGVSQPFHVQMVRVWQKPGCGAGVVNSGPPGFWVSATTNSPPGNDANAGTRAAPFATLGACQTAMRGSANKTCYIRAGTYAPTGANACNSRGNCAVGLTSADNNEVWTNDPADGVDTADITGGSTASGNGLWGIFSLGGASNVTINGLKMHNFDFAATIGGASGVKITNNLIYNGFGIIGDASLTGAQNAGGIMCYDCTNMTVAHNVIHDMASIGISVNPTAGGSINNLVYDSNVIYNTCTAIRDCGAMYTQDLGTTQSTGGMMVNNYVRDGVTFSGTAGGWGQAAYLDNCASNWTVTNNVFAGNNGTNTIMYHGGGNNVFKNNIIDLAGFNVPIARFQGASCPVATGNVFQNNIIVSNGTAGTYNGTSGNVTVSNNAYFNYDGGTLSSTGDSSPVVEDPSLSCYSYILATGSLAKNSPVLFKDLYRGWGPPGYVINQTFPGTPPSPPHGC